MTDMDFTDDSWLFLSPWCKHLEKHGYFDAIALAWVALWNYTIDPTSVKTGQIRRVCKGLFDIPTDELIDILKKRRAVFSQTTTVLLSVIESYPASTTLPFM